MKLAATATPISGTKEVHDIALKYISSGALGLADLQGRREAVALATLLEFESDSAEQGGGRLGGSPAGATRGEWQGRQLGEGAYA